MRNFTLINLLWLTTLVRNCTSEVRLKSKIEPVYKFPWLGGLWRLNQNISIKLFCEANYPVELVTNNIMINNGKVAANLDTRRAEWSFVHQNSNGTFNYTYTAFANIEFEKLVGDRTLICRAIANHSDNIFFTMKSQTVSDLELFYASVQKQLREQEDTYLGPEWPCKVKFMVQRALEAYYWKCTSELFVSDHGTMEFTLCVSAENCANIHRDDKTSGACVTEVQNFGSEVNKTDWALMPLYYQDQSPGIAFCSFRGQDQLTLLRAVEYFYEVKSLEGGAVKKTMRFSFPNTTLHNLLWLHPAPRSTPYYSREKLKTSCCIPLYGFALHGQLIVTRDGTPLEGFAGGVFVNEAAEGVSTVPNHWKKDILIDFHKFGAGLYLIECLAPVFNTTEWVSHNRTIEVRDGQPLRLPSGNKEHVKWVVGEVNKTLNCDATGDPPPTKIIWEPKPPGSYEMGSTLHIPVVTTDLPDLILCRATNQFEESLMKIFHLNITWPNIVLPTTLGILATAVVLLVFTFVSVKLWKRAKRAETLLTDEEVKEFLNGTPAAAQTGYLRPEEFETIEWDVSEHGIEMDEYSETETDSDEPLCPSSLPINPKFEVKKENFIVDSKSKLGQGAYGVVCKGHIKLHKHDQNPTPVAVKQVPENLDTKTRRFYLAALMSELKILAYVGPHENIAKLVGAYWANVRHGTLYVGVEFCKTSLLQFLRDNRKLIGNQRQSIPLARSITGGEIQTDGEASMIAVSDMVRWARQIATGMEFLSRKRVVHGDLAARNVLLTFDLNAKVCDFGLARQLINTVYIKTSNSYLPWQWMAIESLRHREFSTRSDVWAFGVTLWEIFTLGDIPYPTTEWTQDGAFLYKLIDGLRLPKPEFASDDVFEVMLNCWKEDPTNRPKFAEVVLLFNREVGTPDEEGASDH